MAWVLTGQISPWLLLEKINDYCHGEDTADNGLCTGKRATRVAAISPDEVSVKDHFADFCKEPGCPCYGNSMSCPPNVSGPEGFRKKLAASQCAVVIPAGS